MQRWQGIKYVRAGWKWWTEVACQTQTHAQLFLSFFLYLFFIGALSFASSSITTNI